MGYSLCMFDKSESKDQLQTRNGLRRKSEQFLGYHNSLMSWYPRIPNASIKVSICALVCVCTILPSTAALRNPNNRSQQHDNSSSPRHAQELASFICCDANIGAILVHSIDRLDNDSC
jgi:hypothetical protein